MNSCPNCHMFQTQSLSPYGQCQHCGIKFSQAQRGYPDTTNTEMIRLSEIVSAQSRRIAELEAEVALLKKPSIAEILKANGVNPDLYGKSELNDQRFESDLTEICPIITEEGQG